MKYVKQIGIILGITLAGECLNQFLPLPVPAGVYGLFLLLGTLLTGAVKLESVEGLSLKSFEITPGLVP